VTVQRHRIRGSEVGEPRPIAWMRRGRTRRSRSAALARPNAVLVCAAFALFVALCVASLVAGLYAGSPR
jgi:hypothetical protein